MALELKYRLYSLMHFYAKKILNKKTLPGTNCFLKLGGSSDMGVTSQSAKDYWMEFIYNSKIIDHSDFHGFHYAGFILEKGEWTLPSWIWTNAAIVKTMLLLGKEEDAVMLGELIASKQDKCGGWIVRFDYDERGPIPMLAPNDSAYIANNAFLSLYNHTGDKSYIDIAERCAQWIISTCREDGMVHIGYNLRENIWDKNVVIVDVGFTAGLFANLYTITRKEEYKTYLKKFTDRYMDLFFNDAFAGFATSIDKHNNQQGGYFGRGQAWALEGLIPAYRVLKDTKIEHVIEKTIAKLLILQNSDGSWPYNLSRKMMGNDCKAVSVIAKSLIEWYAISPGDSLLTAIKKAYQWCCRHTEKSGEGQGGIFSFCTEGGIVKDLYSSCAFVYSSAYALEVEMFLNKIDENNNSHK